MKRILKDGIAVRYFYTFLFYLCFPVIFARLLWRSIASPGYRDRILERLGFYNFNPHTKSIWVHAVSVGEVIASVPVVKSLKAQYPNLPLVITTMTPTGAAQVKAAFNDRVQVQHVYLPYDLPGAVQRFLKRINPCIAIIVETELWPNLLHACKQQHIPICLINARLSAKSAKGYARVPGLTREMLGNLSLIAAHGDPDAQRFLALGALPETIKITGNIKFDLSLPADLNHQRNDLRAQLGSIRFIWVAASTHEGEEEIILAAHQKVCAVDPNALLILVPRHPQRFDAVAKLSVQKFITLRRSQQQACHSKVQVYLGDTMGELLLFYAVADVAFIAGSLIPRGGHNMLEAGAQAKAIVTGPHLFNFAEISELFVNAKALTKVHDASTLAAEVVRLMQHPQDREQMGKRAYAVVAANRGALAKQLVLVNALIYA